MADPLQTLLSEEKWCPLVEYLNGYTIEDLEGLTEEEIKSWAKREHQPLMHLFVKRHLSIWLNEPNPFIPVLGTQGLQGLLLPRLLRSSEGYVWDLKKRVHPIQFASLDEKVSTLASLVNTLPSREVTSLDLRYNNFMDADVPLLRSLVDRLQNCQLVNISCNRIYGKEEAQVDDNLKAILDKKQISWLDITVNPLASIDRADFFASLSNDQLKKLIWIPFNWLDGSAWRNVLPPSADMDLVRKIHEEYYAAK